MSWKVFITAFVSLAMVSFPQNLLGCAEGPDPYDYYTSFFSKSAGVEKEYRPFYHTTIINFYDDWDWSVPPDYDADPVIREWKQYCKVASSEDVFNLVYKSRLADLTAIASGKLTDSLRANEMVKCLATPTKKPVLEYLKLAKEVEGFTYVEIWDQIKKISAAEMNRYILLANSKYKAAPDAFLKNKYGFLRCKLAFYDGRYEDCIKWYNEQFNASNTSSVNQLALSYKAGSYFRTFRMKEAAYFFSKAFSMSGKQKKRNFIGFYWSTDHADTTLMESYLAFCKTKNEKALMAGMFALHRNNPALETLEKVYELDPASPILPILVTREVNKLEENYLAQILAEKKDGKVFQQKEIDNSGEWKEISNQVKAYQTVLSKMALNKEMTNRGFYIAAAAYVAFIGEDYLKAKTIMAEANSLTTDEKIRDQLKMTRLLVAVHEKGLDEAREKEIIPAIEWLLEKAKADDEYRAFYRNFFTNIIALYYENKASRHKMALAYGTGEMGSHKTSFDNNSYFGSSRGMDYVRDELNSEELLKLHTMFRSKSLSPLEKFMLNHASFNEDDVVDVIGTNYLRNHDFVNAISWLKKAVKARSLTIDHYDYRSGVDTIYNVDPFFDYLNDWQRFDKTLTKAHTKLTLAQQFLQLSNSIDTAKNVNAKSKLHYRLASGLYNISYYGNSWLAVTWYRPSDLWNEGNYSSEWEKEYFGVHAAKDHFQKAYELATDKEFKAAAFFMMAKCVQRQVLAPDYKGGDYSAYENKMKAFEVSFKNNPLFPAFNAQFEGTKFYQYTYNRCSYLRDFLKK
jgi:hypothetical protein